MGLLNFLMCPNRLVTHAAAAALLWTVCDNFGFRFLKIEGSVFLGFFHAGYPYQWPVSWS